MRKSKRLTREQIQLKLECLVDLTEGKTFAPIGSISLEDTLEILEVYLKYRMFDLEATRRELKAARNNV